MKAPFAEALISLKHGAANDLVKQINVVFKAIVTMELPDLIAAWQTLDILSLSIEAEGKEREVLKRFQDAVVNRMVELDNKAPRYDHNRPRELCKEMVGEKYRTRFMNN